MTTNTPQGERADLLETLGNHRYFLRHTVQNLTEEQARLKPTASELSLGGLIKHVSTTEASWAEFIRTGKHGADETAWGEDFRMTEHDTLPALLEAYAEIARQTDELAATVDLDFSQPLPEAPWFEPGKHWSNRRVLLHIIAETSQHAGHADIIRETIDGQKTMG